MSHTCPECGAPCDCADGDEEGERECQHINTPACLAYDDIEELDFEDQVLDADPDDPDPTHEGWGA